MKAVMEAVLIVLFVCVIATIAAERLVHRQAFRCHRWYSAAASARDSLWIITLRPECQP